MGSDLRIKTETFLAPEDHRWLGSAHGTDICDSITLDGDFFLTAFPTGVIPSGVVLGKVTASGKYRTYDDAAMDGTQAAKGHLFTTIDLGGITSAVTGDVTGALFWHGEVVEAKLPTSHGLDAAAKVDLVLVRYV